MDDLSLAEITLLLCCGLLAVLAAVYFWRNRDDEDEWKASSLRGSGHEESTDSETTKSQGISVQERKADQRGRFQKFVEYPIFFGYAGFALGILIPAFLVLITLGEQIEDTRYELAVFYGVLLIWNIGFACIFKFRLKLPIIPIPISWAMIPLFLIGIWGMIFDKV